MTVKMIVKATLWLLLSILLLTIAATCLYISFHLPCNNKNQSKSVSYELMQNDTMQAVVLIKEPIDKEIDSARLERIADSLFNYKPESSIEYARWYRVQFFYMKNFKKNMYYAQKFWSANYGKLRPVKFEITHITGNDIQDSIYDARINLHNDRNLQSRHLN